MNSYDEMPYPAAVHPATDPSHIYAIAKLLGVEFVIPDNSNVLELGCANGLNLTSLASIYPEAKFTGVDSSDRQIQQGNRRIEALGLTNICLLTLSIEDVTESLGEFDYILVHGVYSWVPEETRSCIFKICENQLSQNGLAYISYNVLPGWNSAKSVRDMMLFHSKNFEKPLEKVLEARRMLGFIRENVQGESHYSQMLKEEVDRLVNVPDAYLFHDHLEATNDPCYFRDFADQLSSHNLQYVGDTLLGDQYLGNYSEKAKETLKALNDTVQAEQYLDFLANRRFKRSIICKSGKQVSRNISPDRMEGLEFTSNVKERTASTDNNVHFESVNGTIVKTSSSVIEASLRILESTAQNALTLGEISRRVAAETDNISQDVVASELKTAFVQLVLQGVISVSLARSNTVSSQAQHLPCVLPLAMKVSEETNTVPNLYNTPVQMDVATQSLLKFFDGTKSKDELVEIYIDLCLDGTLTCQEDGKTVKEKGRLIELLPRSLETILSGLNDNALPVR